MDTKNRILVDISRTILIGLGLPKKFWAEAVNTACYVTTGFLIRSMLKKTRYELLNNKKPKLDYLRAYRCNLFFLNNDKDDLRKFDPKSDERVFVGYSSTGKVNRVFNKRALYVEESVHVIFDELRSKEDLRYKDDTKLEELYQI